MVCYPFLPRLRIRRTVRKAALQGQSSHRLDARSIYVRASTTIKTIQRPHKNLRTFQNVDYALGKIGANDRLARDPQAFMAVIQSFRLLVFSVRPTVSVQAVPNNIAHVRLSP